MQKNFTRIIITQLSLYIDPPYNKGSDFLYNDSFGMDINASEVVEGNVSEYGERFVVNTRSHNGYHTNWLDMIYPRLVIARELLSYTKDNEYYKMDSKGEKEFAQRLENNLNVLLFTKLKKGGFIIDTPYGNYSPDWAIVCRKNSLNSPELSIYFIV